MGVLFYSLLYQLLGGIAELHLHCERLPVFFKQRHMRFYPGWAFALPTFLLRVPYSFVEATMWTHLVYWLVGFDPSVRWELALHSCVECTNPPRLLQHSSLVAGR